MTPPQVVGLGSHHGDDQVGWLVVDRLQERGYPRERLTRALTPADVLDVTGDGSALLICDACQDAVPPGTIARHCWPTDRFIATRHAGSHDLSLTQVLTLRQQLNHRPQSVELWTISGRDWHPGAAVSEDVQRAAAEVADIIGRTYGDA